MSNKLSLGIDFNQVIQQCENPFIFCRFAILKILEMGEKGKREILEELTVRVNSTFDRVKELINQIVNSTEQALKDHYERRYGGRVVKVIAISRSRLIVNAKNNSTSLLFETGTMLHPIFGIPYIPGSCIKGVFRNYMESLPHNKLGDVTIEEIFGDTSIASDVIVTDAYPIGKNEKGLIVEPEVTTAIYRDERGENPKENAAKPTIIPYLVVSKGVKFVFLSAFKKEVVKKLGIDRLDSWFISILGEGLGAKTTLGYGIFEVVG